MSQENGALNVGDYRYLLWRTWDEAQPRLLWAMLNPSTPDGEDPTVRRCKDFSQRWGYGSMEIVNLFAYRTSNPQNVP
ncbi:MAG: DUF1643 domain-containing protein [Ktedonobacterales bacterium]